MMDEMPNLIFVIGCPRSGTTWLQLLLAQHPSVATCNETHLFEHFIGPALERWQELEEDTRDIGLRTVMSREEFVSRQRTLARDVYDRISEPDTEIVVDKTPDHALWVDQILTVIPDASFLHLIRDPRDVTASLLAAGGEWGEAWAPNTAYEAAWRWCEHVRGARRADAGDDRFREVRYEDLFGDPQGELCALLRWLGLDVPPGFVEAAVDDTSIESMRSGRTDAPWDLEEEPEGFVRKGGTGNWRRELSPSQVAVVEYVCRDLMDETGYSGRGRHGLPPARLLLPWARDQIRRLL